VAVTLQAKNIDQPDEQRSFEHGQVQLVRLPGATIGRAEFEPGWRWSTEMRPHVDSESCQLHHIAYVVSGRFHVRMDDGRELDLGPGDAHVVGPGHDAWVVGDEPCVTIDFIPGEPPAQASR
jgi:mannose-6-phosphate isomerase-like protein (cupin superfamily)